MRSPAPLFDLKALLTQEVHDALARLSAPRLDAEAIHKGRVHVKRARALARIGAAAAPGLSLVFDSAAQGVMHLLEGARDAAALSECARRSAKGLGKARAAPILCAAESLEAEAAHAAQPNETETRERLRELLAIAQVWPPVSDRQIHRGAERLIRRARSAYKRAAGKRTAERRHRWRKREKDRLYAMLLLGKSWPDEAKRRKSLSAELSEALGAERDTILLMARIQSGPAVAGGLAEALSALLSLTAQRRALAKRCDTLGARLHRGGV